MLPQKISNAEIVVVVGADAEDVPSSIAENLFAVVVVEHEENERCCGNRIPSFCQNTDTHSQTKVSLHAIINIDNHGHFKIIVQR